MVLVLLPILVVGPLSSFQLSNTNTSFTASPYDVVSFLFCSAVKNFVRTFFARI